MGSAVRRTGTGGSARNPAVIAAEGLHLIPRYGFTVVVMDAVEDIWVPEACTLPTEEQPVRLQEFDQLFASALRAQARVSPRVLRWSLDPTAEGTARDLTTRETECCSFFQFTFAAAAGDGLTVEVTVPAAQVAVLDALQARAGAGMSAA